MGAKRSLDKRLEQKLPSILVDTLNDTQYRNARYAQTQFKRREPEKYNTLLLGMKQLVLDFDRESQAVINRADKRMKEFYRSNRAYAHLFTTAGIFYVAFLTVVVVRIIELV